MSNPQQYDHPVYTSPQFDGRRSTAGTTSAMFFPHRAILRVKAAHFKVVTQGTSDTGVQTVAYVGANGTATALGTMTLGTATVATQTSLYFGTGSNPKGVETTIDPTLSVTNAVDGTVVYDLTWEYEIAYGSTLAA